MERGVTDERTPQYNICNHANGKHNKKQSNRLDRIRYLLLFSIESTINVTINIIQNYLVPKKCKPSVNIHFKWLLEITTTT